MDITSKRHINSDRDTWRRQCSPVAKMEKQIQVHCWKIAKSYCGPQTLALAPMRTQRTSLTMYIHLITNHDR